MLKWFLPQETDFYQLFNSHISVVVRASEEFLEMVKKRDMSKGKKIYELEHEADKITHICIENLHKTFITPFQREDMFRMISRMDDIIDFIKDAALRVAMYKLDRMTPEVEEMADILHRSCKELERIIHEIKTPREGWYKIIKELENDGDKVHLRAVGHLFESQDPVFIIKWKEIYDTVEMAIDSTENVASFIEGIILESA